MIPQDGRRNFRFCGAWLAVRAAVNLSIIGMLAFAGVGAAADISGLAVVAELSRADVLDAEPSASEDGLAIVYYRFASLFDPSSETFLESSRPSRGEPFGAPSASAFAAVLSTARDRSPWMSNDRLRLFFASDREGRFDLYEASRSAAGAAFGVPSRIGASQAGAEDTVPRLAGGELALYFMSDRDSPGAPRIYRAVRASTAVDFANPALVSEIPSGFSLLDVSENERALLLLSASGDSIFGASRASLDVPFSAPFLIQEYSGSLFQGGSFTGDLTRVFLGIAEGSYDPMSLDLAEGQLAFEAQPQPTPTPRPHVPEPKPAVSLAADSETLAEAAGDAANPRGAAFDSQGRLIFFDQKATVSGGATIGSNQLMRLTLPAGPDRATPAALEILAAQSDFAAVDSRWNRLFNWPVIEGLETLPDDSVVLLAATQDYPATDAQRILRVIPGGAAGGAPTVKTVARFTRNDLAGAAGTRSMRALAACRLDSPPILYFAVDNRIYQVASGATDAIPAFWREIPNLAEIRDLAFTCGGSLIAGGRGANNLIRIDRATGASSPLLTEGFSATLGGNFYEVETFDVRLANGDILGLYRSSPPFPETASDWVLFRVAAPSGGLCGSKIKRDAQPLVALDYLLEEQIFADRDIAPWLGPFPDFALPGCGLAVSPNSPNLYCCMGTAFDPPAPAELWNRGLIVRIAARVEEGIPQTGIMYY